MITLCDADDIHIYYKHMSINTHQIGRLNVILLDSNSGTIAKQML